MDFKKDESITVRFAIDNLDTSEIAKHLTASGGLKGVSVLDVWFFCVLFESVLDG